MLLFQHQRVYFSDSLHARYFVKSSRWTLSRQTSVSENWCFASHSQKSLLPCESIPPSTIESTSAPVHVVFDELNVKKQLSFFPCEAIPSSTRLHQHQQAYISSITTEQKKSSVPRKAIPPSTSPHQHLVRYMLALIIITSSNLKSLLPRESHSTINESSSTSVYAFIDQFNVTKPKVSFSL